MVCVWWVLCVKNQKKRERVFRLVVVGVEFRACSRGRPLWERTWAGSRRCVCVRDLTSERLSFVLFPPKLSLVVVGRDGPQPVQNVGQQERSRPSPHPPPIVQVKNLEIFLIGVGVTLICCGAPPVDSYRTTFIPSPLGVVGLLW